MIDSEIKMINPPSSKLLNNNANNSTQRLVHQPSTSTLSILLIPGQSIREITKIETQYGAIVERLSSNSETEMFDYYMSNANNGNEILDGIFCAILVEKQNTSKYLNYVNTYPNGWNRILYNANFILCEAFSLLKPQFRPQMVHFIGEAIKLKVPMIECSLSYLFRSLSNGTEFRETCQLVLSIAQILNENHQWILGLCKNAPVLADAFALMSRFIVDAHLAANYGIPPEIFKSSLIAVCEFLIHNRFPDLALQMGKDFILSLMRLAKLPQFLNTWKLLLHSPISLMPNYSLQQQLIRQPSDQYLGSRISFILSREINQILQKFIKASHASSLTTDFAQKLLEPFKNTHLIGPDNGTMRAEIIRYIWALLNRPEERNNYAIEARAVFLSWLLRTAKMGAEQQWCKLMLFWEWFGFDPRMPNGVWSIEPAFSTTRNLLTVYPQLGNSLIDFLIRESQCLYPQLSTFFVNSISNAFKSLEKANMLIQPVLAHSRLEQPLRDQLRSTFPDLYPKKIVAIADNLAQPSSIIDFEAIRTSTTPPVSEGTCEDIISSKLANGTEAMSKESYRKPRIAQNIPKTEVKAENTLKNPKKEPVAPSTTLKKQLVEEAILDTKEPIRERKRPRPKDESTTGPAGEAKKEKLHESKAGTIYPHYTQAMPSTSTNTDEDVILKMCRSGRNVEGSNEDGGVEEYHSKNLDFILPIIHEELRERLELLNKAVQKSEYSEEVFEQMHSLVDSIFDENELVDVDQARGIARCLRRIFSRHLLKKSHQETDVSSKELVLQFKHPINKLFHFLVKTSDGINRKTLLSIIANMRCECSRMGYLFLFYMYMVNSEYCTSREVRVDKERVMQAYKDISNAVDKNWETMLIEDLEACSFDGQPLFPHILLWVLANVYPYGSPTKLIRLICSAISPRQLTQLMSEITREKVVLFDKPNMLALLHNSLKWESMEQYMVWQLIQIEAVEFDKFLDLLQRLSYEHHPEATAAILVIIRNMEPDPVVAVMRSLLKNLLLRPPDRDLFTVDALKLMVDYDNNIPPMSDCISKLVKSALHNNDISAPGAQTKLSKSLPRVLAVESIMDHLDRLRSKCSVGTESNGVEALFSNTLILEMFASLKTSSRMGEIRSHFEELFDYVSSLGEKKGYKMTAKPRRGRGAKGIVSDSREGTPTKKKPRRRIAQESDSEDEDDD